MTSSLFLGSACSPSLPRAEYGSGFNTATPTFTPFGRYADIGSQRIRNSHTGVRLHVGSTSTLYLEKGTLLGMDISYISQAWSVWDAESTQAFYEQILPYIHPETLRPLMGICAPTVIGLYNAAAGRLSLAMELPHPVGWREADPHISTELKEKVITAYQNIHSRNILHNDVKLENMLIGDDDRVTIVDFCKMVINPEPADLALEMRVVKFALDYDGAKEIEYERLRRAESRTERNLWRSRLRRTAKSQQLAEEVEPDEPPSQDEIIFPPFSRRYLMKWDSEFATEGTTHCPGWKGKRFEVPEDMQSPPWPGIKDYSPPTPLPYQSVDFAALVKSAFGRKAFTSHSRWMKECHYFPYLRSAPLEPAVPNLERSVGASSSSTTSSGSSDYGGRSGYGSTTDVESPRRDHSPASLFVRKHPRTEEFSRPDDYPYRNKRARRSKSLESVFEHEVDPAPWAIHPVGELGSPLSLFKSKGKEREPPPSATSTRNVSFSANFPTLTNSSPNPRRSDGSVTRSTPGCPRRRRLMTRSPQSSPTQSTRSSARTPIAVSPRRKSERECSVVVRDGDEEDKVWLMSEEALQDVKGYLQVKKAAGGAIEVHLGGEEGGVRHSHLRVESAPRSSSTRPTRKRGSNPEDNHDEALKPKRRRSWPEINPYPSKPRASSLLYNNRVMLYNPH